MACPSKGGWSINHSALPLPPSPPRDITTALVYLRLEIILFTNISSLFPSPCASPWNGAARGGYIYRWQRTLRIWRGKRCRRRGRPPSLAVSRSFQRGLPPPHFFRHLSLTRNSQLIFRYCGENKAYALLVIRCSFFKIFLMREMCRRTKVIPCIVAGASLHAVIYPFWTDMDIFLTLTLSLSFNQELNFCW